MKVILTFPELEHVYERHLQQTKRGKQVFVIDRYDPFIGGRAKNPENCVHYMERKFHQAQKVHADYIISTYDYDIEQYFFNKGLTYRLIAPAPADQASYFKILQTLGYTERYIDNLKKNWNNYLRADRGVSSDNKALVPAIANLAVVPSA